MLVTSTVITALIVMTALYVGAEFAAVSVRRSRLRRLAEDGNRLAARLLPLVEDPRELDRYIAASQIGITLGSLVLGAYGQATLSDAVASWLVQFGVDPNAAQSSAAAVVLVALTALAMLLGELIPKSLALQYPTEVAIGTFLPMHWSLRVYAPFIKLLNGSGILLLRLFGADNSGHRHIHSPEEIELLIAESRDGGLLEPDEQMRLHRALQLGRHKTKEVMVPRPNVVAIDAEVPFERIVTAASESAYARLPVYRGTPDNVIGIIRTKDLVQHFVTAGNRGRIEALLRPVPRVTEDMPADRLLAFLREQRAHQAIVVGADGHLAGLVTLQDVLARLLRPAEQRRES